jgi:hypothetical protein
MEYQDKKCWHPGVMWISLFCLYITGCTVGNVSPVALTAEPKAAPSAMVAFSTQTAVASPTTTPLPTLTFTPSPILIVLPAVTMSPQIAEDALQELLRTNGNCTGKCVAGIRPDDMSVQQAIDQMAQWGMLDMSEDNDGRTFINTLYLDPRHKQVDVNLTITMRKKFETIYTVSFYIPRREDGEYLGADVWLANREAWRAFRFNNLLKAYGTPSFVGFSMETRDQEGKSIAYTLELHYEKMNLNIGIGGLAYGNGEDVFLCPSKDPHSLGIDINPERPLRDIQQFTPITWQALTGTDLDAFYRTFTDETNPDGCVKTTLKKIMELDPYFH